MRPCQIYEGLKPRERAEGEVCPDRRAVALCGR